MSIKLAFALAFVSVFAKGEKVRGRKFESKDKPLQDFCGRLGTPEKGLG